MRDWSGVERLAERWLRRRWRTATPIHDRDKEEMTLRHVSVRDATQEAFLRLYECKSAAEIEEMSDRQVAAYVSTTAFRVLVDNYDRNVTAVRSNLPAEAALLQHAWAAGGSGAKAGEHLIGTLQAKQMARMVMDWAGQTGEPPLWEAARLLLVDFHPYKDTEGLRKKLVEALERPVPLNEADRLKRRIREFTKTISRDFIE